MRMRRLSAFMNGVWVWRLTVRRRNRNGKSNRRARKGFHSTASVEFLRTGGLRERQRDRSDERRGGRVMERGNVASVGLENPASAIESQAVLPLAKRLERFVAPLLGRT